MRQQFRRQPVVLFLKISDLPLQLQDLPHLRIRLVIATGVSNSARNVSSTDRARGRTRGADALDETARFRHLSVQLLQIRRRRHGVFSLRFLSTPCGR